MNLNKTAKSILSLTSGKVISLILNFIAITIAARHLGVDDFGAFNFLLAITMVISKVVDLGVVPIVYREQSREPKNFTLFNIGFTIRFVAFLIVIALFNIIALFIIRYGKIEILLTNLLLLNILFSAKFVNVRELMEVPYRVKSNMNTPVIWMIADGTLLFVFTLIMVVTDSGIHFFVAGYVISNIPGFFALLRDLKKKYKITFRFDSRKIRWLLKESLSIYGYAFIAIFLQQTDTFFLKYYHGDFDIGIYSVAIRLVAPFLILPSSIVVLTFPLFAKDPLNDPKPELLNNIVKFLSFVAIATATFFVFKSAPIITILFGEEFAPAAITTSIFFWSQIFVYFNFLMVNILLAHNRQKWNFYVTLCIFAVNVIIDIILIPVMTFEGAAVSKLVSYLIGTLFYFFLIRGTISFHIIKAGFIVWIISIIAAGYIMSSLSLFFYIPLLALFILASTIFLKVFDEHEIRFYCNILNRPGLADKIINILPNYRSKNE